MIVLLFFYWFGALLANPWVWVTGLVGLGAFLLGRRNPPSHAQGPLNMRLKVDRTAAGGVFVFQPKEPPS